MVRWSLTRASYRYSPSWSASSLCAFGRPRRDRRCSSRPASPASRWGWASWPCCFSSCGSSSRRPLLWARRPPSAAVWLQEDSPALKINKSHSDERLVWNRISYLMQASPLLSLLIVLWSLTYFMGLYLQLCVCVCAPQPAVHCLSPSGLSSPQTAGSRSPSSFSAWWRTPRRLRPGRSRAAPCPSWKLQEGGGDEMFKRLNALVLQHSLTLFRLYEPGSSCFCWRCSRTHWSKLSCTRRHGNILPDKIPATITCRNSPGGVCALYFSSSESQQERQNIAFTSGACVAVTRTSEWL